MSSFVADGADVDSSVVLGLGCQVWHLAQIREQASLGDSCVVGRGAYIGTGVEIGARVKIQNHALVYEPARIADGVFIGPAVVLTNDQYPRAITPDGELKAATDWDPVGVTIEQGASLGARAVCVAPVTIGRWAMVAAGSVVNRDVPAFALVAGVPARRIGWVGRAGVRLLPAVADPPNTVTGPRWSCPRTGAVYDERDGLLEEER